MKALNLAARLLFGLVFIFSGFVKAIDPLGSAYKFQDYFSSFGTEWAFPLALPLSVVMSGLEFLIGVAVLLGLRMRYAAWGGLLFMAFFTPLTLYIALFDPVPDCGCFGDALIISNWDTFYKNLVISAAIILIFIRRNKVRPLLSVRADVFLAGFTAVTILLVSIWSLRNLPPIDFRPWKIGNFIPSLVMPVEEEAEVFLIFENRETGERAEYLPADYPWNDTLWMQTWTYVDQRRVITREFQEAPVSNFYIQDEFGDDFTEFILSEPGYHFMVIAWDLLRTNTASFKNRINPLAEQAEQQGYSFIVLTSTPLEITEQFRHKHQTPYPFYASDEIALKTIIRSNPGLLLMKDGVVIKKWAHRNIPDLERIRQRYMQSD